jgi:hypothetical protein
VESKIQGNGDDLLCQANEKGRSLQVESNLNGQNGERNVSQTTTPVSLSLTILRFIANIYFAFQDKENLYFV